MSNKPITVRLLIYGQKANVAAIRTRATALLEEEHGTAAADWFDEVTAAAAHAEVIAKRLDTELDLKPPGSAQAGLAITLPEMNERCTVEWLNELPVAKTCVCFATWISNKEPVAWQMLVALGQRSSESRPTSS